jgi:hypothetical protein
MSLDSSLHRVTQSVRPACMFRSLLIGGMAVLFSLGWVVMGVLIGSGGGSQPPRPALVEVAAPAASIASVADKCAVPKGIDFEALDLPDQSWLARRLILCADVEAGASIATRTWIGSTASTRRCSQKTKQKTRATSPSPMSKTRRPTSI